MCEFPLGIFTLIHDHLPYTKPGKTLSLDRIRVRQNLTPSHFKWLSLSALRHHHREFVEQVDANPNLPIRLRLTITDTIQFHYLTGDVGDDELNYHYLLSNEPEHSSCIFNSLIRTDHYTWPSVKLHREGLNFGVADGVHRLALLRFRGIDALAPSAYEIIDPTPLDLRLRDLVLRPARIFRQSKDKMWGYDP